MVNLVTFAGLVVLPFTSASSSLVLSLSIFSFHSFESSFSIHEESAKEKRIKELKAFQIKNIFSFSCEFEMLYKE